MQVKDTAGDGGPPVVHPGWCDRGACVEADGEVVHRSELRRFETGDAELVVAWVRGDEVGADQRLGDAELRIDIRYVPSGPVEQLFLTPWEVSGLAELLLELCSREGSQRAPLGRMAPVVGS
jgi:hypothetical protein